MAQVTDAAPVGWPDQLADQPFDWAAPAFPVSSTGYVSAEPHTRLGQETGEPARPAEPVESADRRGEEPAWLRQETSEPARPSEPIGGGDARSEEPARLRQVTSRPTGPIELVDERREDHTPTEVEQAEEEHLDWLRHLPERRDEAPAEHPPAHGRADPPPPREPPRREWVERLVVGLLAGLVTFAATRWAGAGWSTAAWIGLTVLVVVPTAAWVATLGHRSSATGTDPTTKVGT